MRMKFENTTNGYIEESKCPWFWLLCFGWMYLAYKGAGGMAFIWIVAYIFTMGISMFIFPFFAKGIIEKAYKKRGWKDVTHGS